MGIADHAGGEEVIWRKLLRLLTVSKNANQLSDQDSSEASTSADISRDEVRRAQSALYSEDWQEAINACTSALEGALDHEIRWLAFYVRGVAREKSNLNDEAIADFTCSLDDHPHPEQSLFSRGKTYFKMSLYDKAFPDWLKAAELNDDDFISLNAAATLLAASPNSQHRDGAKAIALATKACELTDWQDHICIDTLASSFAESGDFEAAGRWQQRAIHQLATDLETEACEDKMNEISEMLEYTERLVLFGEGKPYRLD